MNADQPQPMYPLAALANRMRLPVIRLINLKRQGLLRYHIVDGVTHSTEADISRALELDADDELDLEVGGA